MTFFNHNIPSHFNTEILTPHSYIYFNSTSVDRRKKKIYIYNRQHQASVIKCREQCQVTDRSQRLIERIFHRKKKILPYRSYLAYITYEFLSNTTRRSHFTEKFHLFILLFLFFILYQLSPLSFTIRFPFSHFFFYTFSRIQVKILGFFVRNWFSPKSPNCVWTNPRGFRQLIWFFFYIFFSTLLFFRVKILTVILELVFYCFVCIKHW